MIIDFSGGSFRGSSGPILSSFTSCKGLSLRLYTALARPLQVAMGSFSGTDQNDVMEVHLGRRRKGGLERTLPGKELEDE